MDEAENVVALGNIKEEPEDIEEFTPTELCEPSWECSEKNESDLEEEISEPKWEYSGKNESDTEEEIAGPKWECSEKNECGTEEHELEFPAAVFVKSELVDEDEDDHQNEDGGGFEDDDEIQNEEEVQDEVVQDYEVIKTEEANEDEDWEELERPVAVYLEPLENTEEDSKSNKDPLASGCEGSFNPPVNQEIIYSPDRVLPRVVHSLSGEKLFQCSICEKNFNKRGKFREHMRTHTGENLFSVLCV